MPTNESVVAASPSPVSLAGEWTTSHHKLATFGPVTRKVLQQILNEDHEFNRLLKMEEGELIRLAEALTGWADERVAALLTSLHSELSRTGKDAEVTDLCRWVAAHRDDPEGVVDCLLVRPPVGVTVLERLSRAGSQKRVYLADWAQAPAQPVVLKRLLGTLPEQLVILGRELQSHPLAARHPNIISTHVLHNGPEPFLVEERLHQVLNDGWRSNGTVEAANLLHDIALALAYIHEARGWVHGDIKPDNIGRKDGAYILLDFGICRPAESFTREATATGSLRTRAPELFQTDGYDDAPQKADVWALGATVYRAVTGRFLFIDEPEPIPKIDDTPARSAFEEVIATRIASEWDRRVVFNDVPGPLDVVLRQVLVRSPAERPTAKQLVRMCGQKLAPFLRSSGAAGPAPEEEVGQLLRHLSDRDALRLMPAATRQNLTHRLREAERSGAYPVGSGDLLAALLKALE